jgi:hypothetical protein
MPSFSRGMSFLASSRRSPKEGPEMARALQRLRHLTREGHLMNNIIYIVGVVVIVIAILSFFGLR